MTESYLLSVILFAPFVGAAVLATPWVSNRQPLRVRQLAALFSGVSFFASFYLLFAFDWQQGDRKSTRLNSSHSQISYAVFCLKKKTKDNSLIYTSHAQ